MPVLTPERASTETVNGVPKWESLRPTIMGIPNWSTRSGFMGMQMRPRPYLAMKLIASAETNWAGSVRSPSFSRASSSMMMTKLPLR